MGGRGGIAILTGIAVPAKIFILQLQLIPFENQLKLYQPKTYGGSYKQSLHWLEEEGLLVLLYEEEQLHQESERLVPEHTI